VAIAPSFVPGIAAKLHGVKNAEQVFPKLPHWVFAVEMSVISATQMGDARAERETLQRRNVRLFSVAQKFTEGTPSTGRAALENVKGDVGTECSHQQTERRDLVAHETVFSHDRNLLFLS
jgi:hypothetical protein